MRHGGKALPAFQDFLQLPPDFDHRGQPERALTALISGAVFSTRPSASYAKALDRPLLALKDRVKILYWDRDGFAVWAKRLEEGTCAMPFAEDDQPRREITAQELGALLSGIDLSVARRRKRYQRKSAEAA